MIMIKFLIEELKKFPQDALCYGYEGEMIGLSVVDHADKQLGFIHTGSMSNESKYEYPQTFVYGEK